MEFWLQQDSNNKFQLPVKPSQFTVTVNNKNTVINVIQLGDINLIGKTGLREITLSSFFPAKDYNFSNNADRKAPLWYVNTIETWRKSGKPIRVIITGVLNMECTIESFGYGEQDATGDIYYTIALKEHKKITTKKATVNVTAVKASTRTAKTTVSGGKYTVVSGDCLWNIAKKFYGNGALYMKIYNANTNVLKNPNTLYAGQVLVIPEYDGSIQALASTASTSTTTASTSKSSGGSKTNPPFTILTKSYGVVKTNITTWNEAYYYYSSHGGSSKGWKIVDGKRNIIQL